MADTRVVVEEFARGPGGGTRILISRKAQKKLLRFLKTGDPHGNFRQTLKRLVQDGFASFTGEDRIVRPEGGGAYRIGIRDSLFRLAGFFRTPDEFVVIDAYTRRGQSRGKEGNAIFREVARVKKEADWREHVNAPRINKSDG